MEEQKKKKVKKKRTLLQRIVNIFLYTGIAVFILLVIAFGFSQTSTFRNYLRDFVIAQAEVEGLVLTDEHWEVIMFLRHYYEQHGVQCCS